MKLLFYLNNVFLYFCSTLNSNWTLLFLTFQAMEENYLTEKINKLPTSSFPQIDRKNYRQDLKEINIKTHVCETKSTMLHIYRHAQNKL